MEARIVLNRYYHLKFIVNSPLLNNVTVNCDYGPIAVHNYVKIFYLSAIIVESPCEHECDGAAVSIRSCDEERL
jgi:hypothetical protein